MCNAYSAFWTLGHFWHFYQDVDEMAKTGDNAYMFRAQRNVYISGLAFALAPSSRGCLPWSSPWGGSGTRGTSTRSSLRNKKIVEQQ